MKESILVFGRAGSLIGVVSEPPYSPAHAPLPAVLFLNAGLIHRVGPNRLWVRLARSFAARGFTALRFDLSGIGDSRPAIDGLALEERWVAEVRAAMDALHDSHAADRFVLIGNCSGAALACATALADPRVVGAGLVNLPARRLLRYHLRLGLSSRKFWLRLAHGRAKLPRIATLLPRMWQRPRSSAARRSVAPRDLRLLAERSLDLLVVSCDGDAGYDLFHRRYRSYLTQPDIADRITLAVIRGASHDFALLGNQERLMETLDAWSSRMREERWRPQQRTVPQ